jgi:hypothetical protein
MKTIVLKMKIKFENLLKEVVVLLMMNMCPIIKPSKLFKEFVKNRNHGKSLN